MSNNTLYEMTNDKYAIDNPVIDGNSNRTDYNQNYQTSMNLNTTNNYSQSLPGEDFSNLRVFLRNLEKNFNNSYNTHDTVNKKQKNLGFTVGIYEFNGLFKDLSEENLNSSNKFYLRYFVNMYNMDNKQMCGNTYRSPLLKIKFNENEIQLEKNDPLFLYVLCQGPSDVMIMQLIFTETTPDDIIIRQSCIGWTFFKLCDVLDFIGNNMQNQGNNTLSTSFIFLGSPRDLNYKNIKDLVKHERATIKYISYFYKQLENLSFLLPDYIVMGYNEPLPGILLRNLPKIPDLNEEIKTMNFINIFIKNVEIEISPFLEDKILNFANEYRKEKYPILEEQNKTYVKERKLKCGIHNTWKFINSNGLENSVTLTKNINGNLTTLNYGGTIMIDKYFNDSLFSCAIVLELHYVITVPISGKQKEDTLSLPVGYSIFVPGKLSNNFRDILKNSFMITGPGETLYGDNLWSSPDIMDKYIKINYVLSQNENQVNFINFRQNQLLETQQRLEYEDKNNLKANDSQILNENINNNYNEEQQNKILHLQQVNDDLLEQLRNAKDALTQESLKRKQDQLSNSYNSYKEPEIKEIVSPPIIKTEIKYVPQNLFSDAEMLEFKKFQQYQKNMQKLEEEEKQKNKITYDENAKKVSSRDKATLISKGILDLAIKEEVDSRIDYVFDKEISDIKALGNIINFQFLSFKPSKSYYKELKNVPEKIQFSFNFYNIKNLKTPVCNVTRPENSNTDNYNFFNNPLILTRENINITSTLTNDIHSNIINVEIRYDPSIDTTIDYRDFIKYLLTRQLLIQIFDVQKNFNVGSIKVPLKDLLCQGKPRIQNTNEYIIYDDDFKRRGYIQLLLSNIKTDTIRKFDYNKNIYKNVNSKDGYNTLKQKKKVKAIPMNINNLVKQNKNLLNYTNVNFNKNPNETINEKTQNGLRKFRLEPEMEKKIRVMRYFSNKNNPKDDKKSNTNINFGVGVKIEEGRLQELRQKKLDDEQFNKNISTCMQLREINRAEILSKVTEESHKNIFNISLVMGQPLFFNYSIFNDSDFPEIFHIIIQKLNSNDEEYNSAQQFNNKNVIISVINTPMEWTKIVNSEKLLIPNNYNILSPDLYFEIKPKETIPLVIKLLSFIPSNQEDNYIVSIHRRNGQPMYCLNINVFNVFPIYDHIFHYYLPCNFDQKVSVVNPFKNSKRKTMNALNNLYCTDKNIQLSVEQITHDFSFFIKTKDKGNLHEFIIFIYSDENLTKLYLTWKFEINCMETFMLMANLGQKNLSSLKILFNEMQNGNNANNLTLQLFSDNFDSLQFPKECEIPFTIFPNTETNCKFILYPKNTKKDYAIINCVNIYTRELYENWLIKYNLGIPTIAETVQIECNVGDRTGVNYECSNPLSHWVILKFESGDEEFLEVVDKINSFNIDEKKSIKFVVPPFQQVGRIEVLVFVSAENEEYCRTLLFQITFK